MKHQVTKPKGKLRGNLNRKNINIQIFTETLLDAIKPGRKKESSLPCRSLTVLWNTQNSDSQTWVPGSGK